MDGEPKPAPEPKPEPEPRWGSNPPPELREPVGRGWTSWLLRLLLTLHAAMVVAQPVLIGSYLDGNFDQLAAHRLNGSLLPVVDMLCLGGALCHWLVGRGRFWPVPVTLLLIPVEGLQIGVGYQHNLAVHIPLGTAIVAGALFLAAWAWTPRIRQFRELRPRPVVVIPTAAEPGSTAGPGTSPDLGVSVDSIPTAPARPRPGRSM